MAIGADSGAVCLGLYCFSMSVPVPSVLLYPKIIIESMMEFRPRQGNLWLVFRLFSRMRGLPSIRLK